ncbi:MAG: hypothetical protein GY906_28035 [bacterium]|nr:hypothetical protein [bacterium]
MVMDRKNRIAQWAFDTRSILGRFHLWLDDVEERWIKGVDGDHLSFVGDSLERAFIAATAVTALGTRLFGRYGEGRDGDKALLNRVKKDADAVSAYALSEALWYLTRSLPENHAVMISLGEGLMPKAGETPEMGSNPLLGFGRVYARPQVARFLDRRVNRLLNEEGYEWQQFWGDIQHAGITVWGGAVDTLENTSRFAKGADTGPMTTLHLFDQPLRVTRPYEGYMGTLALPREVVEQAADRSVLINYLTPRRLVMESIVATYPNIVPENVHIWTLGGDAREPRIGSLWREWKELGAHLIEDGWTIPQTGMPTFTESGTYAPSFRVGPFTDSNGRPHLILADGYAASAEAMQAASLDPVLDLDTSLVVFSSTFQASWDRECGVMQLDPQAPDFRGQLARTLGREMEPDEAETYRSSLTEARVADMPLSKKSIRADDFFPNKRWRVLALASYMLPDPYTGAPGVEQTGAGTYRVTTHAATRHGILEVAMTLRMMEPEDEMLLVFSPLLDRFYAGQDFRNRAVKISDSGRIRNELQTLALQAIETLPDDRMRLRLDNVDDAVLPPDKKALILEVLRWYKTNHPIWFHWLETP